MLTLYVAAIGGWGNLRASPLICNALLLSLCLCFSRSYIYQKRWVRLDADHLRYFDSNKVRPLLIPDGTPAPAWP